MNSISKSLIILLISICLHNKTLGQSYEPNWRSVRQIQTPQWLQDGKFGIYTHWGPYAVHAFGSNTTWYSYSLYQDKFDGPREHFAKTFGELTPEFGYKDLIPMFTAEKFDADEWADLFQKAGAKFAGPVAEHHDGFAMWDTKYSEWNAATMGPKRDVVGELAEAMKKRDMKFVTAFHHAANWFFFPVWDERYDTGDPKNSGLYGQYHEKGAMRNQEFIDEWYNKIIEVIDNYGPDFIWFDFALDALPEGYILDFLAYYYNWAEKNGKEVVVTYKDHDLIPGAGVRDLELGQESEITYNDWITDSSIDDRGAWGWANDLTFKTPNRLIDNLVDRVSKNGYLLLNIGPKPDGSIPEGAKEVLLEMGAWLEINGDAIYNTTPWFIAGEGPTRVGALERQGFNESGIVYTPEDIRFTVNDNDLYATFLGWPGDKAVIKTIRATGPDKDDIVIPEWAKEPEVKSIAGTEWELASFPPEPNIQHYKFLEGGKLLLWDVETGEGQGRELTYEQVGTKIIMKAGGLSWTSNYDGKEFKIVKAEQPHHPGFYKEEIKRITMLGDDRELDWVMTGQGLIIKTPEKKGKYAYSFKIERYRHPQLD